MRFKFPLYHSKIIAVGAGLILLAGLQLVLVRTGAFRWHTRQEEQRVHSNVWDENRQDSVSQQKIAPDLAAELEAAIQNNQVQTRRRVLVQLSEESLHTMEQNGFSLADDTIKQALRDKYANYEAKVKRRYAQLGMIVLEIPLARLRDLEEDADIAYLSPDRPIEANGYLETTSGADAVRTLLGHARQVDGRGIGVAVLDSGIYPSHELLAPTLGHPGVVYQKDFAESGVAGSPYVAGASEDQYGHGTHIATLLAGNDALAGRYQGLAPAVKLVSLRVLDGKGKGYASNLIAALDWCIANKEAYNIRVVNISLGTPARDSYRNDPLCLAARRAFDAGLVVVASAGNYGKDAHGNKIYGGISAPGLEPSVITVGASNDFGTAARADDQIATFSSRGPTRGYYLNADGVRQYDNLLKPDLVASGNRLIGAAASTQCDPQTGDCTGKSHLYTTYTNLQTGPGELLYLSGTSLAAPQVAGAAALMLQVNPSLTPSMVKALLQYSAQPLKGYSMLEQGMGALNVDGAVRLAQMVKPNADTLNNGNPLIPPSAWPVAPVSVIGGQTVTWGQAISTNYGFLAGADLIYYMQGIYAPHKTLSQGTRRKRSDNSALQRDGALTYGALNVGNGAFAPANNNILWNDSVVVLNSGWLSDGIALSPGLVLGDGVISDANIPRAAQTWLGDNTAGMMP